MRGRSTRLITACIAFRYLATTRLFCLHLFVERKKAKMAKEVSEMATLLRESVISLSSLLLVCVVRERERESGAVVFIIKIVSSLSTGRPWRRTRET